MKKDKDLTMLEMLFKYKDNIEKAVELLDNYPIKEIKEYYSKNAGNHYCKIIEKWSENYNLPLTKTLSELYEKLNEKIKVFDNNKLKTDLETVRNAGSGLNMFIRLLKRNREDFLSWYKDNVEKYESAIPKASLIKNDALLRCDEYIKKVLFIKFINEDITLYNVDKEKDTMNKKDIIKIIEDRIERKIKVYREYWADHLNQNIITKRQMMEAEINGLKELLKEINYKDGKSELADKFPLREEVDLSPKETSNTNIWQVFIMPESILGDSTEEDRISLFYNKNTTNYYVQYRGKTIFNTEYDSIYHFEDTRKTWRYRKLYNRIELARGLAMITHIIAEAIEYTNYYPKIKKINISNFLKDFTSWLFINEIPEEDRDENWESKRKLLEKEGK